MNNKKITKKQIEKGNRILKKYAQKLEYKKKICQYLTIIKKKIKMSA